MATPHAIAHPISSQNASDRLQEWVRPRSRLANRLSLALFVLVIISVTGTYITLSRTAEPLAADSGTVQLLTATNLILVAGLIVIIGYRLLRLWSALKEGTIGSQLQTRVITVFSIVTIMPTIVVSIFTAILLNYGIKSWFDERVSTALEESVAVAEAYLEEHKDTIRADALAMANDIQRELHTAPYNPLVFNNIVNGQAILRSLTDALVIQKGRVIGRSRLSFAVTMDIPDSQRMIAQQGEVVVSSDEDKITALTLVDKPSDTYLMISRFVDGKVLSHMERSQGAVHEYRTLKKQIAELQIQFIIVFVVVAVLLLLTSIWYGMVFASKMISPLSRLIRATERVRAGDFSIRVEAGKEDTEIGMLTQRFNRMTEQLQAQRRDLTLATRTMDARRRFTEAVLEGASAGVMALDPNQKITLYNRSATQLLDLEYDGDIEGTRITEIMPELTPILQEATEKPHVLHQGDVMHTIDTRTLTLHARVTTQMQGEKIEGYIVTFDDISPLVSAQRRAAWSDVARRIAHEIKNPLTPIQLSTERLRKKYLPEDKDDQVPFNKYLDTISRHAGDIGNMVEEFVSFARMPQPKFQKENIVELISHAVFSAQTTYSDITLTMHGGEQPVEVICDERQISQIFTNLLKNAAEALERREGSDIPKGCIDVRITVEDHLCHIDVEDNGVGFPPDKIDQMTEPYVTTRAKGTGLGLAIVKKIVEDHEGSIELSNRDAGGAKISLIFPISVEI